MFTSEIKIGDSKAGNGRSLSLRWRDSLNNIKKLLALVIFAKMLCVPVSSWATDRVATGCDPASIQSALNSASSGDTVWFPAGACSVSWSTGVTMNKAGVTLMGRTTGCPDNCVDNTSINDSSGITTVRVIANDTRVSGITFVGQTSTNSSVFVDPNSNEVKNWRIDHNHFKNGTITAHAIQVGRYAAPASYNLAKAYPGVIDHNSITGNQEADATVEIYGGGGTYSGWKSPTGLGTSDFVFIEDNKFSFNTMAGGYTSIDGDASARLVIRYNTFTNSSIVTHGINDQEPSYHDGVHVWEIYNNTFNGNLYFWIRTNMRGGTGVIHHNTITLDKTLVDTPMQFEFYRGDVSPYCTASYACNGSTPQDQNTAGMSGWLCYQQIGATGSNGITQYPVYEWSNTWNGNACGSSGYNCFGIYSQCSYQHVKFGRDVILNTQRPGYTTYTYPHPLTQANQTTIVKPNPPTLR